MRKKDFGLEIESKVSRIICQVCGSILVVAAVITGLHYLFCWIAG